MEKYTGEKDIRRFISFLCGKQLNPVSLFPQQIEVICRALPHHRLLQPYLDFFGSTSDDPPVYFMVCDEVGPPRKGILFSAFVLNGDNSYAKSVQKRKSL